MNQVTRKKRLLITSLYVLGLAGMIFILAAVEAGKKAPAQTASHNYEDISSLWTLDREGTQPVNPAGLGDSMDPVTKELWIYHRLPQLDKDTWLIYRSKDVYTKVFADGELIYEPSVYESGLYNRSPGNLWNYAYIPMQHSTQCLEIQILAVYDTNAVTVDSLYLGDKADVIISLIDRHLFGIIFSILLSLGGVALMLMDLLPTYGRVKRNHALLWLGVFALLIGIWSLIETNVVQFCVKDMRILQLLGNMIMVSGGIMPLLLYMDCEYKVLQNRFMRLIAYADVLFILLAVFLQLGGFADLHAVVDYAMYAMVLFDVILLVWFIRIVSRRKKEGLPLLNCCIQLSGMSVFIILCLFQVTRRYLYADSLDRAGLTRVGMVVLTLCFAISSQLETYKLLEQGMKYDIVSGLAYSDGLTGLGNRTAYLEQLDAYDTDNSHGKLGVVYLDVNNLKKVNDSYGHETGDALIKLAAGIIENSFGQYGNAYRIGGDEFCVLITGQNPDEQYQSGLAAFLKLVEDANAAKQHPFYLQIAHGFAVCDKFNRQTVEDTINLADSEMYRNKTMLKAAFAGA